MSYRVRKVVEFDRSNIEWFEKTHPGSSFWWIINSLLMSYRNVCEDSSATPLDNVVRAAERMKAEIEAGLHGDEE